MSGNCLFVDTNILLYLITGDETVAELLNGKHIAIFVPSLDGRRSQLGNIRPEQIKKILFLNKAAAQAKYGDKVVFDLVEIEV